MKNKLILRTLCLLVLTLLFVFACTGCVGTDTAKTEFIKRGFDYKIQYDQTNNISYIYFDVAIDNQTIYDIGYLEFTVQLFKSGGLIGTATPAYEIDERSHGVVYCQSFSFSWEGYVQSVAVSEFGIQYRTFWETYSFVIILGAILAVLLSALYIIITINKKLRFCDVLSYFTSKPASVFLPIVAIGLLIYTLVSSFWIEAIVVAGAYVLVAATAFTKHLFDKKED